MESVEKIEGYIDGLEKACRIVQQTLRNEGTLKDALIAIGEEQTSADEEYGKWLDELEEGA